MLLQFDGFITEDSNLGRPRVLRTRHCSSPYDCIQDLWRGCYYWERAVAETAWWFLSASVIRSTTTRRCWCEFSSSWTIVVPRQNRVEHLHLERDGDDVEDRIMQWTLSWRRSTVACYCAYIVARRRRSLTFYRRVNRRHVADTG